MTKGFTFLETLIVLGLLAVAISVFLAIWFIASVNNEVNQSSIASGIALRKMEELRATPFSSLPGSGPFSDPQLSRLPNATATISVSDYLATSSIKQIIVDVSWSRGTTTRAYRLDSLFTDGATNPP